MAAGEYLKTASASLYRAADALKQQAKEMQSNLTRLQSDKKSQIDKNAVQIKTKQMEQGSTTDSGQQSRLAAEIAKLQQEIMAAEQELKQAEQNLVQAAAAKINQSTAIESQAKQLETQAGSVD